MQKFNHTYLSKLFVEDVDFIGKPPSSNNGNKFDKPEGAQNLPFFVDLNKKYDYLCPYFIVEDAPYNNDYMQTKFRINIEYDPKTAHKALDIYIAYFLKAIKLEIASTAKYINVPLYMLKQEEHHLECSYI